VKKLNVEKFKNYLYSLRYFILFSLLVFSFGIFYGYYVAQMSPPDTQIILDQIKQIYEPVFEMAPLGQFFFIIFNNGLALVLVLLLGIAFGLFPFMSLLSNGTILGMVAFFLKQAFSWPVFFLGTLPHGIIEIPVLILSGAIGLKIGKTVFQKVFKKEGEVKKELSAALEFFWKILLPLLVIAAAIEIFITAKILGV